MKTFQAIQYISGLFAKSLCLVCAIMAVVMAMFPTGWVNHFIMLGCAVILIMCVLGLHSNSGKQ